jgi:UDP-N-acetylglucosamine diphosphorylase/glucosamine-1-phosphate N-acetyltransferase
MKKIIFSEEFCQPQNIFPFTLTRQVQDIRLGIFTIRQKWELILGIKSYDRYEGDYKDLDQSLELNSETVGEDTFYLVHGNIIPTSKLIKIVNKLRNGDFISVPERESIVYCITKEEVGNPNKIKIKNAIDLNIDLMELKYPWDIIRLNGLALKEDFDLVTRNKKKHKISVTNKLMAPENIFIEKGARVEHCIINAEEGPVYIGANAIVMEGCMLRGPISIGEKSVVKMGTKIYGATTIGPYCTVGGEIKNSVFFGYSNKAHDGYIGDSVIGEWCNLGAGTSNSNVKNNASPVKVWTLKGPLNAGQKCGVMIGDYTRTAINTSINTGSVISVCCNVFGNGLTPKYIPPFSWGSDGIERYDFEKALYDINAWKSLKGHKITNNEKIILKHIFDHY